MPEVSAQPQPTSDKKPLNWKKILVFIVIGVVIIGLGVAGWYFYLNNQEEKLPDSEIGLPESGKVNCDHITLKSTWQTYENNYSYGYTLKYPPDWQIVEEVPGEGRNKGGLVRFASKGKKDQKYSVVIGAEKFSTLETYKNNLTNKESPPYVLKEDETIPFDFDEATRFSGYRTGEENYEYVFHWIPYKYIGLNRSMKGPSEDSKANENCEYAVYQTMLGSYRFGNEYKNKELGFEFRYPTTWEIKEEYFYETAAGSKAKFPTILLGEEGSTETSDYINISLRQSDCSFFYQLTPEEEYVNGSKVKTFTDQNLGTCIEASVKAKDKDGKTRTHTFMTASQDEDAQNIFKQLIDTFKITK